MNRFYWHYPCKPFNITQAWGIYNPIYEKFGFSRHNGIDCKSYWDLEKFPLHLPLTSRVMGIWNQPDGAGHAIWFRTDEMYDFDDGKKARVDMMLFHMDSPSELKEGEVYTGGTFVGTGDNTGFSTGPHTHFLTRRVDEVGNEIDNNEARNTFDPTPYFSGSHAVDIGAKVSLIKTLQKLVELLRSILNNK